MRVHCSSCHQNECSGRCKGNGSICILQQFKQLSVAAKTSLLIELTREVGKDIPPECLSSLYMALQPLLRHDFISTLPSEVARKILGYLDIKSLATSLLVCKKWLCVAINDDELWRAHARQYVVDVNDIKKGHREVLDISYTEIKKNVYLESINRARKIGYIWTKGEPHRMVLRCEDSSIITCLQLVDTNKVMSASSDGNIILWCTLTGKKIREFVGHTGGVWAMHCVNQILLSGSTDRTLRAWRIDTGKLLNVLKGHESTVRCVILYDIGSGFQYARTKDIFRGCSMAVSGSRDHTIRVWNMRTFSTKFILYGHTSAVRCMEISGNRLVSGSYDGSVKLWDLETGTLLKTLVGHTGKVYAVCFRGNTIVSGGADSSIYVWDVDKGQCMNIFQELRGVVCSLQFMDNERLVAGNTDGYMRVFNIELDRCVHKLKSEGASLTCMHMDADRLVSGSKQSLKLWNPYKGELVRDLITNIDTTWKVVLDESVCAAACQKDGMSVIFVLRFDGR